MHLEGQRHRRRVTGGFTVIELLIVIAVIALLVGILLPAISSGRAQSRVTMCVSNVRSQVGVVSSYAGDYQDLLPPRWMLWNQRTEDGSFSSEYWLINRLLADYSGEQFVKPTVGFPIPSGAWRCPEIPVDRDEERLTHSGILHYAPNQWLFSRVSLDEQRGTLSIMSDALPGWVDRLGVHSWRTLHMPSFPEKIVAMMDNVNYYVPSHGHRDARESYGRSDEIVPLPNDSDYDNSGSHAAVSARPAAYIDGHAESLPSTGVYWLNERYSYRPRSMPGASAVGLHEREATHLMWFIAPGDRLSDE